MKLDTIFDRKKSLAIKYDSQMLKQLFKNENCLPFWVADSDFPCPQEITDALAKRIGHPLYGYEKYPDELLLSFQSWFQSMHSTTIKREYIVPSLGVMTSVALAIELFSQKGDGVIIQPPVYMAFSNTIASLERTIVNNPLILEDNYYRIDFEGLKTKAGNPKNKILLLCSPHNPVGRVWNQEELQKMVDICRDNNVLLISDEIHADLIFPGQRFTSILSLNGIDNTDIMVAYSPVKSFNIMSISDGFTIITNEERRAQYTKMLEKYHLNHSNAFSAVAGIAAYTYGHDYIAQVMEYAAQNRDIVQSFLQTYFPEVKMVRQEGTYLVWMDFRNFGTSTDELKLRLFKQAEIALIPGQLFGDEGDGFFRMNIACPKATLEEGLHRMLKIRQ